jgi:cytochrome P450
MTLDADFASPDYFRNTVAAIEKLRAAGPVVQVRFPVIGRVWAPTTQALADQVLKDTETFTIRDDDGTVAGFRWWIPRIVRTLSKHMLSMDDPDHKRLRDIVDEAFRRRAVLGMEPHIRAIGDELADQLFAEGDPADLVARYARQLPLSVISELLGCRRPIDRSSQPGPAPSRASRGRSDSSSRSHISLRCGATSKGISRPFDGGAGRD